MPIPLPSIPSSYYALLEVAPGVSAEELHQAFRRLSKRYHPDTTSLPAAEAAAAFLQLQQGYAVLSDPQQRQRYDAELLALQALLWRPAAASSTPLPPAQRLEQGSMRRPLSGGEWLALLLLGSTLVLSLVLGLALAWLRGEV